MKEKLSKNLLLSRNTFQTARGFGTILRLLRRKKTLKK